MLRLCWCLRSFPRMRRSADFVFGINCFILRKRSETLAERRQLSTANADTVGGSSKGEICARSKGETLEGVISQDFRPVVLGWPWGLGHGPELA